jgi:hypothetical protein
MIRLLIKYKLRAVKRIQEEFFDFDDEVYAATESNFVNQVTADLQERLVLISKFKDLSVIRFENLNIHDGVLALVLKALNQEKTIHPAALALGISQRALWNYRKANDVIKVDGRWIQQKKQKTIIKINL